MVMWLGWSLPEEAARIGFARPPACAVHRQLVCDPREEGHWLCVAPTGSGKSSAFAIPQLLSYSGPVIAVDVKGELHAVTHRWRARLGPVVTFDPFGALETDAQRINPIGHLSAKGDRLIDDAIIAAQRLTSPQSALHERFWEDWASDVIAALIVDAVCDPQAAQNFTQIFAPFSTDNPDFQLATRLDKGKAHPFTFAKLAQYLRLPDVTRGGVSATIANHLRLLASRCVRRSLEADDIPSGAFDAGEPLTIYLVFPPDVLASHVALLRLVLGALVDRLMRRRDRPLAPTLLLVDEAAHLGEIPALTTAITLGRSYGVRVALLVQSLAQLREAYGARATTVLENVALMTFGPQATFGMARDLAQTGFGTLEPQTVFGLGAGEMLMQLPGMTARRLAKLDYRHDVRFRGRFDPNPFYMSAPPAQGRLL